jgi:uncharacterized repeat protein (TIGR01451 family)
MSGFGKRKSLVLVGLTLLLALAVVLLLAPVASASTPFTLTKTDGQTTYVPGETITYTIVLTNVSPDDFDGIQLFDSLTEDFDSDTASWSIAAEGGAVANPAAGTGVTASSVITLPAGSQVTLTFSADVKTGRAGWDIINSVSATYPADAEWPAGIEVTASDTDELYLPPPFTLTKTDGKSTYEPGGTNVYTIVLENTGTNDLNTVSLNDLLPCEADAANSTWEAEVSGGATFGPNLSGTGNVSGEVTLPVGGKVTVTLAMKIRDDVTSDPLTNEVTAEIPGGKVDPNYPEGYSDTASDVDALSTGEDDTDDDYTTVSQIDTGAGAASGPSAGVWALAVLALALAGGIALTMVRPALRRR